MAKKTSKAPIKKSKASTIDFSTFSRRYFNMAGSEIMYIEIINTLCKWIMVDEVLFDAMFATLDFDNMSKFEIQAKLVNFEMKLLSMNKKENDSFISFVTNIELEANGVGKDVNVSPEFANPDMDNIVTYAEGNVLCNVQFDNGKTISNTFAFISGPMGNGATPNGTWAAVKHPTMGLNRNANFPVEYDTYAVFQLNAVNVPTWNDASTYKNRSNLLIHPANNHNIAYPITNAPNLQTLGQTEGCIGIRGIEDCKTFFPFITLYMYRNTSLPVEINISNNKQICKKIYKK